jgi:flagellar biosynthesis/type III secretory pathway M-ring protein FliF/YscJ
LYILIGVIASAFIASSFIHHYMNRDWRLVYTALDNETYFHITANLQNEGIKYKVKTPFTAFDQRNDRLNNNTQYDIYVKKDAEHKAVKAIHTQKLRG